MMGIYNKSTRAILTLLDVGKDKPFEGRGGAIPGLQKLDQLSREGKGRPATSALSVAKIILVSTAVFDDLTAARDRGLAPKKIGWSAKDENDFLTCLPSLPYGKSAVTAS
jgi:hypothetical protein